MSRYDPILIALAGSLTIGTFIGTLSKTGVMPDSSFAPLIAMLGAKIWIDYCFNTGVRR